jgi:hypothetical protein
VIRAARTSGGVGLTLARDPRQVAHSWPEGADKFVAVAPFVPGLPVNFSGCVFTDGTVRLHPLSLQLVGVPACTSRPFGYCGNDFGAATAAVGAEELHALDGMGRAIGGWLHREGYRGAFGVDAIATEGKALFTEMNPRFQGSSVLSARIARELDVPDLFLDHVSACLGLPQVGPELSLAEWTVRQSAVARFVVHNEASESLRASGEGKALPGEVEYSQSPRNLPVDPGGSLGCVTLGRSVTANGTELDGAATTLAKTVREGFVPLSDPLNRAPA